MAPTRRPDIAVVLTCGLVFGVLLAAERSWALARKVQGLRELRSAIAHQHPKHDYRDSRILDESLYRIVEDRRDTGSSRIVFLLAAPGDSLKDAVQPWTEAIQTSPNLAGVHLWVATSNRLGLAEAELLLAATNISYRILEVVDLPVFFRETALNVAPTGLVVDVTGEITDAVVGRASVTSLVSILARQGSQIATPASASIHRFAGAQRIAHPGFNVTTQGLSRPEIQERQ